MHPHPGTDYMHYWPQLNHENNKASPGQESFWQNLVSLEDTDEHLMCFADTCCTYWAPDKLPVGFGCAWQLSVGDQDTCVSKIHQPMEEAGLGLMCKLISAWIGKRTSVYAKGFWTIQEQVQCHMVCSRMWVSAWPPFAMDVVGH